MAALRFRVPAELAEQLRGRCAREGEASSVTMALRLLNDHVDDDLEGGESAMAKGKVPPQLAAYQFKKGSAKAAAAGAKGGKISPKPTPSAGKASGSGKRGGKKA